MVIPFMMCLALTPPVAADSQASAPPAPETARAFADEAAMLRDHVQLTFAGQYIRAGEAYFSPDGTSIIFQAIPVPEAGKEADPFYAMYVATLVRDEAGAITGLAGITRVSPEGSANTCGWFHPTRRNEILFGTTFTRPDEEQKSGFQVGSRKYVWMFPAEMEIAQASITPWTLSTPAGTSAAVVSGAPKAIFNRPNYDAEGSWDPTGRFLLYAHVEDAPAMGRPDANLYIFDSVRGTHTPIVSTPGYDGGPFFSPDGRAICYRSDRKGDDHLQIFVATLKFETLDDGVEAPVGIEHEFQLTQNEHVNWCPFWHPSGKFLVYATSEVGHHNYEVFGLQVDLDALKAGVPANTLRSWRVTFTPGADVLPAFSPDGQWMMWTAQRSPAEADNPRPSSQLWVARWVRGGEGFDAQAAPDADAPAAAHAPVRAPGN